jgi:hypothetical protein
MFPARVDRLVLDSAVDPTTYGPGLFSRNGPALAAALRNWAAWAVRRNGTYRLGSTTAQVLANIDLIRGAVDRRPLTVGDHRVDTHLLPLLLWIPDDSTEALTEHSAMVRVLLDAARGRRPQPTEEMAEALDLIDGPDDSPLLSAQTAVLCADRAATRSSAAYLRDIERHRRAEPLFGPLTRNIGPCAFWPTAPIEPLTRIRNAHPALMLNAAGDTQTPYVGARVMHRLLTGSRLVTVRGAYRHGVLLTGRSGCADRAVERYLVNGVLPRGDVTCVTDRTWAPPFDPDAGTEDPASTPPGPDRRSTTR